jgi:chromosome segregation ATPase
MTNSSNGDRLGRVEANLEAATDILVAVARRAESTDARLDRVSQSQDRMQSQLDQLREDVEIAFETIKALSNNTDSTLASINAALERQDRVLDYLVRRDRNGEAPLE